MTIASLIVDVAANTAALNKSVNDIQGQFSKLGSMATSLAGMIGIGFSATAVISFGKEIMADADALMRMHDQTGITLQGLQKFKIAADDSGNSVDQITAAVSKMQVNLSSATPKAVSAMKELQLPIEDILNLNPENQFIAIANAIAKIPDPAKQAQMAVEIFGKSGAALLPTLKRGFDDLKDGTVGMSDETIRALDEAGDMMGKFGTTVKAWSAEALVSLVHLAQDGFNPGAAAAGNMQREVAALNAELGRMNKKIIDGPDPRQMGAALPVISTENSQSKINRAIEESNTILATHQAALKKAADETQRLADKQTAWLKSVTDATIAMNLSTFTLSHYGAVTLPNVQSSLQGVDTEIHDLTARTLPDFGLRIQDVGHRSSIAFADLLTAAQKMKAGLMSVLQSVPQTLANAFTGGGGLLGAAQSIGSQIGSTIGQGIGKTMSALGSLGGPIGAALGSLVGPLIGGIAKLFSSPEKQINPIRQAFVDAAGGLATLNQRAAEAGVSLAAVLNARTPEAYKKAIDDLNAAFKFQDDAMKTLDATVQKYGFTIEQLGPAMQRQQLDQQAQTLYKDYQVLTGAGLDHTVVLGQMAGGINEYVNNAIAMGMEVPAAMKPMLDEMIAMGLLTDAAGNKVTDLNDTGITFAMTMSEGFKSLIDEVKKLTDAIARGLGLAIHNVPPLVVPVIYDDPGYQGGNVGPAYHGEIPMASGGSFWTTGPTRLLVGEAGREHVSVTPAGQMPSGGGALHQEVKGLRRDIQSLPQQLAIQMAGALALASA